MAQDTEKDLDNFARAQRIWTDATDLVDQGVQAVCVRIYGALTAGGVTIQDAWMKLPWGWEFGGGYSAAHVHKIRQVGAEWDVRARTESLEGWAAGMLIADVQDGYLDVLAEWAQLKKPARSAMVKAGRRTRIDADIKLGILDESARVVAEEDDDEDEGDEE